MSFLGINDAIGGWVVIRFLDWPDELNDPITGLVDVKDRWLQFKLRGADNLGVWLENPYFEIEPASDIEEFTTEDQREALLGNALVLVKWQYIATIIYLEGKKSKSIPFGFKMPQ
jgi:hypothetical protein